MRHSGPATGCESQIVMPDPAEEELGRQGVLSAHVVPLVVLTNMRAATRMKQCQVLDNRRRVASQVVLQQLRQRH